MARVRSPGDSEAGGRATCSAVSPNLARAERAAARSSTPVAAWNPSSRVGAPANRSRAWLISPTSTLGPSQRAPDASGSRPNRAPSSVDFPEPLRPTTATRSPQPTSSVTGPSVKSGWSPAPGRTTTASASRATTSPLRPASAICSRRSQPSNGLSTLLSRASARSVALAFAATCSELDLFQWRMNLSVSPDRLTAFTPWTDHSRWVRARSRSVSRCSA